MSRLFIAICMLSLVAAIGSCSKNNFGSGGRVEIYAFNTSSTPGNCRIDSSNTTLAADPIVRNQDIQSYDRSSYEFTFSETAQKKLEALRDNQALALTVNGEPVFYMINKPMYSSSLCGGNIMLTHIGGKLARTNIISGQGITPTVDLRNDSRIINALRAQGKLR